MQRNLSNAYAIPYKQFGILTEIHPTNFEAVLNLDTNVVQFQKRKQHQADVIWILYDKWIERGKNSIIK